MLLQCHDRHPDFVFEKVALCLSLPSTSPLYRSILGQIVSPQHGPWEWGGSNCRVVWCTAKIANTAVHHWWLSNFDIFTVWMYMVYNVSHFTWLPTKVCIRLLWVNEHIYCTAMHNVWINHDKLIMNFIMRNGILVKLLSWALAVGVGVLPKDPHVWWVWFDKWCWSQPHITIWRQFWKSMCVRTSNQANGIQWYPMVILMETDKHLKTIFLCIDLPKSLPSESIGTNFTSRLLGHERNCFLLMARRSDLWWTKDGYGVRVQMSLLCNVGTDQLISWNSTTEWSKQTDCISLYIIQNWD